MYLQSSFIVYSILEKQRQREEMLNMMSAPIRGTKRLTRADIIRCLRELR